MVDEFYSHDEDDQTQEESETEEPKENKIEETKDSGDGNNTEEQKKLGVDIQMIGARKEELGRTRSQIKEMMSPRNKSMERAEMTMEDWIHETCLISAVTSGPTEPKTFQEAWHSPAEEERRNWQTAIRKENKSMINRGVWRKSNPVRELSKTMDAPAPVHLKEMYKLIRFVLSTKDYGLKFKLIKSIRKWVLKALSDSDFASDKETRISVFGYVIYFCGIQIAWRSRGMKSVVLSTTEAEYMALSEVVKELKFIVQLLQTMNITVELPITVHVDNVGAIWLSNNRNIGDRTKHIDIRTAFVKEYQEDGKIIIKFVKSEDNEADIFTKNTSSIIYQRHQEKLVWDKKEVTEDK